MEIVFSECVPERDELFSLYHAMGWSDFLKLDADAIYLASQNSFFVVCAYAGDKLVGTGRVVSDGVLNAYLCGLGVLLEYRHQGIAHKLTELLLAHCQEAKLHVQFFCKEHLQPFYERQGFERFAIGMRPKD
ncbi:MAG TPA: GNAT family N-acetyltransferase [Anaerolineaceae bacterium]|nr:GNAT family N-acetyltransferase [Anaerolineaceae bacterium]